MIATRRAKRLIAAVLTLTLALVATGILLVSATIARGPESRTGTLQVGRDSSGVPPLADTLVTWSDDGEPGDGEPGDDESGGRVSVGREMEPATRVQIESAYIQAWTAMTRAAAGNTSDPLFDSFTGTARTAALELASLNPGPTWNLSHSLTLNLYALDGATVAFRDVNAAVLRTIGSGESTTAVLTNEVFDVVMTLEDGYWRVRQMRRDSVRNIVTISGTSGAMSVDGLRPRTSLSTPEFRATTLRVNSFVAVSRTTISTDLRAARSLGITTVRLPLPFDLLGGDRPTSDALASVSLVLEEAHKLGMGVIPVLLADEKNLSTDSWQGISHHVASVVDAISASPAIIAWDLCDQPDNAVDSGQSLAETTALLVHLSTIVRSLDPDRPQTISWATTLNAADPELASIVDAVGLHISDTGGLLGGGLVGSAPVEAAELAVEIDTVRRASPTQPLILTISPASVGTATSLHVGSEKHQEHAVAQALLAGQRAGITRISVAELIDIGPTATSDHSTDGLLRADRTERPAALLFASDSAWASTTKPGWWQSTTAMPWAIVAAILGALAIAVCARMALRAARKRFATRRH